MGYVTKEIIADLESFLGYNNTHDAILVGVGGLGKAFLGYGGFENYGLNIVAAFDNNEKLVNTRINGKPVYDVSRLQSIVARFNIKIGIITVPSYAAQEVADRMVAAESKRYGLCVRASQHTFRRRSQKRGPCLVACSFELADSVEQKRLTIENAKTNEIPLQAGFFA